MIDSTQETRHAGIDPREVLGFSFPTAQMLDAAVAMFTRPALRQENGWAHTIDGWSERATYLARGSWPELKIAPGMVAYRRHDRSADERAREKQKQSADKLFRLRKLEHGLQKYGAMAFALTDAEIAGLSGTGSSRSRGQITNWSTRSRTNLVKTIVSLDLAPLVMNGRLPVMVTLTLPDRWEEVMPDGEIASKKFDRFRRAWSHKWGAPSWIWKREFQGRGAPHWHLWLVPPADEWEFKTWLSAAWTDALDIQDIGERMRSYGAGTNVSQADGMAARDPKRLAIYFLKESLGGEGKAYQNAVPAAWRGKRVGRFWGYAGIELAVRTVELDPRRAALVWRILRHVRSSKGVTRQVLVQRVNQKTGVVRYRKVRRRAVARGSAGWIAVNDGASMAVQLARYLDSLDPLV